MQNVTFIASHDFTLVCESGDVEFKKGDLVDFCHNEEGDVWISHYEEDQEKVHAFEIEITDKDLFSSLLENSTLVEAELDDKISYEELSIDKLLIEENIDMARLMQYMVEANFTKAVRSGKVTKVPVRKRKQKLSPKQKAARMKSGKKLAKSPAAKKARAKSMKVRKTKGLESFVVDKDSLFDNSLESVSRRVYESLSSFFGEKAKVKLTKENKIQVNLFNADEEQLKEALESLEVYHMIEGKDDIKVITFFKPEPAPVVESYYAENEDKDLMKGAKSFYNKKLKDKSNEEAMKSLKVMFPSLSDEDLKKIVLGESSYEDDDDMDYMEMCGKMHSEMKAKMKEMEESDDEVDMDKAKDMVDSYKEKMKKMKEMDDEKEMEGMYKEMEKDYKEFMKMMDK